MVLGRIERIGGGDIRMGRDSILDEIQRAMLIVTEAGAKETAELFGPTVYNWSARSMPEKYVVRIGHGKRKNTYLTGAKGRIYAYVSKGTASHIIPLPSELGTFQIPGGYTARTKPLVLGSGESSYSTTYDVRDQVQHPGIEARRFDLAVKEELRNGLLREMADTAEQLMINVLAGSYSGSY